MRFVLVAGLLFIVVAPGVAAHGAEGFGHLNVDVADLAPNQSKEYHLDPSNEGGMITLSQGWVFGVYGALQTANASVHVGLLHDGIETANWTWNTGYHGNTTRLQFSGAYQLRVHNPGNATVRYALYYDQSCNCKGKLIPLPGGWNLFNYDLPAKRQATIEFPLAVSSHVRGSLATLSSGGDARWPTDFKVLQEMEAKGPEWLRFNFQTGAAQRYYVYVEAVAGATLERPLELTPLVKVEAAQSPGVDLALMVLALAVGGAAAVRRVRGR